MEEMKVAALPVLATLTFTAFFGFSTLSAWTPTLPLPRKLLDKLMANTTVHRASLVSLTRI